MVGTDKEDYVQNMLNISIRVEGKEHEVAVYATAEGNYIKGLICAIEKQVNNAKLKRLIVQPNNPTVREVRRIKKHTKKKRYLKCSIGVVYKIPLSCGRVYNGQTGRCINDRLAEHALSIGNGTGSHLPYHCRACTCKPLLRNTCILRKSKDKVARELAEAMYIQNAGDLCVSVPSVTLYQNEYRFLVDRF